MFHSSGHEASEWPQLYKSDHDFATTYQMLGTCEIVTEFHIQYGILCPTGNLHVPSREHEKLIWESHYSQMVGHFLMENTVVVLHNRFYWLKIQQDVNKQ
jgi:hypothetical protein